MKKHEKFEQDHLINILLKEVKERNKVCVLGFNRLLNYHILKEKNA